MRGWVRARAIASVLTALALVATPVAASAQRGWHGDRGGGWHDRGGPPRDGGGWRDRGGPPRGGGGWHDGGGPPGGRWRGGGPGGFPGGGAWRDGAGPGWRGGPGGPPGRFARDGGPGPRGYPGRPTRCRNAGSGGSILGAIAGGLLGGGPAQPGGGIGGRGPC